MTEPVSLSRAEARRIAVRAQLLAAPRPTELLNVVRGLTLLQLEPTSAIAPSADLVLWSRLGSEYSPLDLREALDRQELVELRGMVRPAEDIGLYQAEMAAWPGAGVLSPWQESLREWVEDNRGCRLDILRLLREDGPLPLRELPDTCVRPWKSSGWNNNRNVRMMLDLLVQRGEVAAAGWEGRERLWDLASRVYPETDLVPLEDALRIRDERRLASLGLARPRATQQPGEPIDVGQAGVAATVEGVRGAWRVDPAQLDQGFRPRAALLSPFDRLVQDRKRMAEVFEFEYFLEMYKPEAKRRWGYYALPILSGDRLVGKLDAQADLDAAVLRVAAVHRDVPFDKATAAAVEAEVADLAAWLDLDLEMPG